MAVADSIDLRQYCRQTAERAREAAGELARASGAVKNAWLRRAAELLRARLTSPGGTTQAAIECFEGGGFRPLVDRAIAAATERGRQLSAAND